MKKLAYILGVLLTLVIYSPAGAINVNGVFGAGEWDGYSTSEDNIYNTSTGYVSPGYGGQAFDVEHIGLMITGSTVYFGLQTGFNVVDGVTYGGYHYNPGDFALDVDNDGAFEYAIRLTGVSGSIASYNLVRVQNELTSWDHVMYPSHAAAGADPYRYSAGQEASVYSFTGAYGVGPYSADPAGATSYVLEGSFDIANLFPLYSGGPMKLHWTMECGNDFLEVTSYPVPEPSTLLLIGTGLAGTIVWRRRKG